MRKDQHNAWKRAVKAAEATTTPEQQAVALAEKHGLVLEKDGSYGNCQAGTVFLTKSELTAMLAERDKQHTEELAQQSGVMPQVVHLEWCRAYEVREAIATLEAKNKKLRLRYLDLELANDAISGLNDVLQAQIKQMQEGELSGIESELRVLLNTAMQEDDHSQGYKAGVQDCLNAVHFRGYTSPPLQADACKVPQGWRIEEKETCFALSRGNESIANFVGPGAKMHAEMIAAWLSVSIEKSAKGKS